MKYVAFLRGINSGKNPSTKMADLKALFNEMGFSEVSTVLASGNVIFTADQKDIPDLEKQIENAFVEKFSFTSPTIVRTVGSLAEIAASEPFSEISQAKNIKQYISFIKYQQDLQDLKLSYPIKRAGYEILTAVPGALLSYVDLDKASTLDLMAELDKLFYNRSVTTRGWKTIDRILKKV